MQGLDKKNILVILPFYFGYQKIIKSYFTNCNANTWLIDEDVNEFSFFYRVLSVYFPKLYHKIVRKYYHIHFKQLPSRLDYVLIIKGSTLTSPEVDFLRNKYQNIKFIMYQWDSVANYSHALDVAKWCDYCFTFDPKDAEQYGWKYRPLFFDENSCTERQERNIDITYICSLHSERVKLYKSLQEEVTNKNLVFFDHLFSNRWSFYRQKYLKRNKLFDISSNNVKFHALPMEKTIAIYDHSKALVDYKFDAQNGLTMRTIESIGHKCKLITNNKLIANEDFYDPNNILIYDNVENLEIPVNFLHSSYKEISEDIYKKYTVEGWAKDIFNLKN